MTLIPYPSPCPTKAPWAEAVDNSDAHIALCSKEFSVWPHVCDHVRKTIKPYANGKGLSQHSGWHSLTFETCQDSMGISSTLKREVLNTAFWIRADCLEEEKIIRADCLVPWEVSCLSFMIANRVLCWGKTSVLCQVFGIHLLLSKSHWRSSRLNIVIFLPFPYTWIP